MRRPRCLARNIFGHQCPLPAHVDIEIANCSHDEAVPVCLICWARMVWAARQETGKGLILMRASYWRRRR